MLFAFLAFVLLIAPLKSNHETLTHCFCQRNDFMLEDDDEFERGAMGFYEQATEERIAAAFKNCGWVADKVTNTSAAFVRPAIATADVKPNIIKTPAQETVVVSAKEARKALENTSTIAKPTNAPGDLIRRRRLREWDSEILIEFQQNELWKGAVRHALDYLTTLLASVLCPRGQHLLMRFRDYHRTYRGVYGSCQSLTR